MGFERFAKTFWMLVAEEIRQNPRGYITPDEFYEIFEGFYSNRQDILADKTDYLRNLSTMNRQPIFETKEFTARQRRKVFSAGQELYYKRMLQWRFGQKRGWWVYQIGRILWIRQLLLRIVHTKIGHRIFCILSHQQKEDIQ